MKKIAVIAGDGIGREVIPEGLRVLDAVARKFGIQLGFDHFDFASCDYFAKHGQMMLFILVRSVGQISFPTRDRYGDRY